MARIVVPADVDPDEAAAAMAAVMLFLHDDTERDGGGERWLLTARLEALRVAHGLDMARHWRRR